MAEMATETPRLAPFGATLTPGRYGAKGPDGPAVTLGLRHPLSIVAIMARKGRGEALDAALRDGFGLAPPGPGQSAAAQDLALRWAGPEQWFAIAAGGRDGDLHRRLAAALADTASLVDQSHGRVAIVIAGPRARAVLAKGTAVDLHPARFRPGQVAMTQMAHVGVQLTETAPDVFELLVFRSFAESLFEFLAAMAAEYGYEVGSRQ
ncbi:MAG: sarcosine oxidase subunit gamma family protein [Aestuariivirgaceae bacterium]